MRKIVDMNVYENQVSKYNKSLIKDFLIEKKAQGRAVGTLKQYQIDLRIVAYLVYLHFNNKRLIDLTRKDIRNLMVLFQDMNMSNSRANGVMSALRSCLEFCADDDDYEGYEFNVGSRVRGLPKKAVRDITFLTDEQIKWLINKMVDKGDYLLASYLSLSYESAGRKNEVYQTVKSGLSERYFTNQVIGKRGKKFRLYYTDQTKGLIAAYLEQRGKDLIPELFVKIYKNGRRDLINKGTFNYWCCIFAKMLSDQEGKEIYINPHCFRHSRLENLSRSGVPLEQLKVLANHSDISTTEGYLADRSEETIAGIFKMDAKHFIA